MQQREREKRVVRKVKIIVIVKKSNTTTTSRLDLFEHHPSFSVLVQLFHHFHNVVFMIKPLRHRRDIVKA
jgi:hypothetical protein